MPPAHGKGLRLARHGRRGAPLNARGSTSAADLEERSHVGGDRRRADRYGLGTLRASGEGRGNSGTGQDHRAELGGNAQPAVPQQTERVVDLVDDLQYPLHAGSIRRPRGRGREWYHILASVRSPA